MKTRTVSIVSFINSQNQILLQDRKNISKRWEERWFFWLWVEEGETKEQALEREIQEELWFCITDYKYLWDIQSDYGDLLVNIHIFIWQLDDISNIILNEWAWMQFFSFDEAFDLKKAKTDNEILQIIKNSPIT